jgi:Zn finger protein HypA/HybF involved in hydrogenase expression
MHEIHFADKVLREARKAGARNFFRVEVGELCEITVQELEEGLKKLTSPFFAADMSDGGSVLMQVSGNGTLDSGMDFVVDFKESKIKCLCGFLGRAEIADRGHGYCIWSCPSCGLSGKNVEVLEGGEIKITEFE